MLTETIKSLNLRLIDYFGKFENGEPNFKLVWSEDEIEKRLLKTTVNGIELLFPETAIVPKYSYIKERFILERIVPIPNIDSRELLDKKLSYEPIWVFESADGEPLAPDWEVINILITTLLDQNLYKSGPYKLPEGEGNTTEELEYRAKKMEELLFGDETKIGTALAHGSAVGYGTKRSDYTRFNNNPIKVH